MQAWGWFRHHVWIEPLFVAITYLAAAMNQANPPTVGIQRNLRKAQFMENAAI